MFLEGKPTSAAHASMRRKVTGLNPSFALFLAIVRCMAGTAAITVAFLGRRPLLALASPFALFYAVAWFRVSSRSKLLTWREFVMRIVPTSGSPMPSAWRATT